MAIPQEVLPELIAEDHIWLLKLKEEFYFSSQEARNLKKMMKSSYEDVYRFCLNDTFEDFDSILICTFSWDYDKHVVEYELNNIKNNLPIGLYSYNQINPRGYLIKSKLIPELVYSHMRGRYWLANLCNQLVDQVENVRGDIVKALEILFMNKDNFKKILSNNLLARTENLSDWDEDIQKLRAQNGERLNVVTDDNLEHLNFFHMISLLKFYDLGLRASMMRGEDWFNHGRYFKALKNLIVQQKLAPINAVTILHQFELFQVQGLSDGLTLEEVKQLKNYSQVELLRQFKQKGLTVEQALKIDVDLIGKIDVLTILLEHINVTDALNVLINLNNEITDEHCAVLNSFLEKGMKIDQAINLVTNMNSQQVRCICQEINYTEVIGLNNVQAMTLRYLYSNGLRGMHLRGKEWFDCPYHKDVLAYLVRKLDFNIINAFEVINNTNWLQILKIMKDLVRLDLTDLNHYQIMALLKLNHLGLKKEHLIGCAWFNSIKHKDYLINYMNVEKMDAVSAMKLLQSHRNLHDLILLSKNKSSLLQLGGR